MEFLLKGAGLWRIVSGMEKPPQQRIALSAPPTTAASSSSRRNARAESELITAQQSATTEAAEQQFQTRSDLAASYLYSSLTIEARKHLGGIKEPRAMWEILKTRLNSLSREVGIIRTHTTFLNDKMTDVESLSPYIARLTGYQTELAGTRKAITDEDLVSHLLTFLPVKYHNIRRHIWDRPIENQTMDYVRNTLLEHEAQTSLDTPAVETTALAAKSIKSAKPAKAAKAVKGSHHHHHHYKGKYRDNQRYHQSTNRQGTRDLTCFYCLKKGHFESDCRLKKQSIEFRQ